MCKTFKNIVLWVYGYFLYIFISYYLFIYILFFVKINRNNCDEVLEANLSEALKMINKL